MLLRAFVFGAAVIAGHAHAATLTFTTHALSGQTAPRVDTGFTAFGAPVMVSSGSSLLFSGQSGGVGTFPYQGFDLEEDLPPGTPPAVSGLYVRRPFGGGFEPLETVARTGDAPGGAGAPVIATIRDYDVGQVGDLGFTATTTGAPDRASALYYQDAPGPLLIAKAGDPAELLGVVNVSGATIERFDGVRVTLGGNEIVTVTRNETLSGDEPFLSNLTERDDATRFTFPVANSGQDAPGGGTLGRIDQFDASGSAVAFTSLVRDGTLTRNVLIDVPFEPLTTALVGGQIVDGLRVDQFLGGVIRVNDSGTVAYQVRLTDPVTNRRTEGIVVIDANGPRVAFRGGEMIGDTGFTYGFVSGLSINREGDLLLAAVYDGRAGGGTDSDWVLSLLSAGGSLTPLLRTGDMIEVAPGDTRRLGSLAISHGALADAFYSSFAFAALFDDGSQGVFSARYDFGAPTTPAPIPLPAAGWLLVSGIGVLMAVRRRA